MPYAMSCRCCHERASFISLFSLLFFFYAPPHAIADIIIDTLLFTLHDIAFFAIFAILLFFATSA